MPDFDVVVVGGGPAGLTAGRNLARDGVRTLVLEREMFGGALQHTAQINGMTGAQLAAEMIEAATTAGATLLEADVAGLELFSRQRWVACADGSGYSCSVVVLAAGTRFDRLGLPNEERLRGRGVIDCTPCDGGFFIGQPVAIYGNGPYAHDDLEYLSGLGAHVTLLDPARVSLTGIVGDDRVEAITYTSDGSNEMLPVRGLAVRHTLAPNSEPLRDSVECDAQGYVVVDPELQTSVAYVLACGDLRANSPATFAAAVDDGARAAAHAVHLLRTLLSD